MSEMIERLALTLRAIDFTVSTPNYYQVARAVIEAMREPTNAMIVQGDYGTWIDMIDEALDKRAKYEANQAGS